jgi:hypothetical protein
MCAPPLLASSEIRATSRSGTDPELAKPSMESRKVLPIVIRTRLPYPLRGDILLRRDLPPCVEHPRSSGGRLCRHVTQRRVPHRVQEPLVHLIDLIGPELHVRPPMELLQGDSRLREPGPDVGQGVLRRPSLRVVAGNERLLGSERVHRRVQFVPEPILLDDQRRVEGPHRRIVLSGPIESGSRPTERGGERRDQASVRESPLSTGSGVSLVISRARSRNAGSAGETCSSNQTKPYSIVGGGSSTGGRPRL